MSIFLFLSDLKSSGGKITIRPKHNKLLFTITGLMALNLHFEESALFIEKIDDRWLIDR